MEAVSNSAYSYRSDYRAQSERCASQHIPSSTAALSPDQDWCYPQAQFTVSPQANYARVPLPSMYSVQRPPDQNYPSPSPSVPSPGPRLPSQLEYSSHSNPTTPPSGDGYSPRDSLLGPVRNLRARQISISYKQSLHGRRHSVSDSQLGERDQDDLPDSRPQTPHDGCHPELIHPGAGLSLTIPSGMDPSLQLHSPYQPTTPTSLYSSPAPYTSYNDFRGSGNLDGRPPSPTLSVRTSGSANSLNCQFSGDALPPPHGKPATRIKKHTKKKLDALDKKRICTYHLDHQNARQEDIAEMFGIERSTVSKILKNKNQWMNVDDNAETHSKNRPSKFPELEEVMRKFLQECIDRDTSITDSLIRTRALEVAKTLFISEEKFKASSGWIENFKHRHGIRSGKWCPGVKSVPASHNPNPGLNGTASSSASGPTLPHPPSSSDPYHMSGSESSDSLIQSDSPDFEQSRHGDRERPYSQTIEDQQEPHWSASASSQRLLPPQHVSNPPTSSILHHHHHTESLLPSDPADDAGESQGYALSESLVYPIPREPDIQDAENSINTLIAFFDNTADQILQDDERRLLTTIKCALFQYASGVPFNRP